MIDLDIFVPTICLIEKFRLVLVYLEFFLLFELDSHGLILFEVSILNRRLQTFPLSVIARIKLWFSFHRS